MKHEPTPVPGSTLKWIGIPVVIAIIFMGILYLAMATEPDYMPAQQKKAAGVDLHAKHANSSTEEHASHSETEHAEAIAEEQTTPATDEHNAHSAH